MVGLISSLVVTPLVGALALFTAPARNARPIALLFNALAAFEALLLWQHFDIRAAGFQLMERHAWIPAIGAEYLLGWLPPGTHDWRCDRHYGPQERRIGPQRE